jgi:hypothetical protein
VKKRYDLVLILAVAALAGCAFNAPLLVEKTRTASGTNSTETVRALRIPSIAVWPATSTIESQKATLGKSFIVGTAGEKLDGGGTNVTEALKELNKLLGR